MRLRRSQGATPALVPSMKVLSNIKHRLFLPALAALSVLGMSLGYAAHVYAQEDDCCYEGSPCCHPGAPCCASKNRH
ncbi:MAG: hypothetical protein K0R38_4075 [Polyangiaceae bacterium]|nr:hypothetical protein [Polyangiaceae bacterium]